MSDTVRTLLIGAGLLLIALAAYTGARHWQAGDVGYQRVAPDRDCDLRQGPCRHEVTGGVVVLSITPTQIPSMQPLALEVQVQGLPATGVVVDVRGLNMDMGLNRTRLELREADAWRGETILPICSQREMKWEAAVQIDADPPLEIPFLFSTSRP